MSADKSHLQRVTLITPIGGGFFSTEGLQKALGYSKEWWLEALIKELVDNSLDSCENRDEAPEVTISINPTSFTVSDNGAGLASQIVKDSLDYTVFTSDKVFYVSPTRGRQGNGLKCVWAAPYVWSGKQKHGKTTVIAAGIRHTITVRQNGLDPAPTIQHTIEEESFEKKGTSITLETASYADEYERPTFYKSEKVADLIRNFAAFNPHVQFRVDLPSGNRLSIDPSNRQWKKWWASNPTSPHWYSVEQFRNLIIALIEQEGRGGRSITVREFVSQFHGLTGSIKPADVLQAIKLRSRYLHDLQEVDSGIIRQLLEAMQQAVRRVRTDMLGTIGQKHFHKHMVDHRGIDSNTIKYTQRKGYIDNIPYSIEVCFGEKERSKHKGRIYDILYGFNWSPSVLADNGDITRCYTKAGIDIFDPVSLIVHIAYPGLQYTDPGKTQVALPEAIRQSLAEAITAATKQWPARKKAITRHGEGIVASSTSVKTTDGKLTQKKAAYMVMEQAYMKASNNNTLPANARQIMYAARALMSELGVMLKDSNYFTQHLLPDYYEEHCKELTHKWNIVYDGRGHLIEPHTRRSFSIGTMEVRNYLQQAQSLHTTLPAPRVITLFPTHGPGDRFQSILFIEKEGFHHIIDTAGICERFDMALMSTKGMVVTAGLELAEGVAKNGVTIYVLHDFDKAGFSIADTIRRASHRYKYSKPPIIVDIGLRLEDIQEMNLASEYVSYDHKADPKIALREYGATEEECTFLAAKQLKNGHWEGQRVELNAMTSGQFVAFIERQLNKHRVEKVVPSTHTLERAFLYNKRLQEAQKAINHIFSRADDDIVIPHDLESQIRALLEREPLISWDMAIQRIIEEQ